MAKKIYNVIYSSVQIILLTSLLLGCASADRRALDVESGYFFGNCQFFDGAGKLIRSYPNYFCAPQADGSLFIADGKTLKKQNQFNQILWRVPFEIHHQLKISQDQQRIYFLTSNAQKVLGSVIRTDGVQVLDQNGKTLLSFDFNEEFVKKYKLSYRNRFKKTASMNANGPQVEMTHVNSIQEILNEKKQVDGYIVNCLLQRRIFIFDKNLKEIQHVIETNAFVHDVQLFGPRQLIYYVNEPIGSPQKNRVILYDMTLREAKTIFQSAFQFEARGGLQMVDSSTLILLHSPNDGKPFVEIVNLADSTSKIISLQSRTMTLQEVHFGDYKAFLQKNLGN